VQIENLYRDRSTYDPHTIEGEDIVAKTAKTHKALKQAEGKPYLRLRGCPVSVAEQVQALVAIGGLQDPSRSWPGAKAYITWKSKMLLRRMSGHKYQIAGPTQRGDAAPEVQTNAAE
jgi:hypothetical protein